MLLKFLLLLLFASATTNYARVTDSTQDKNYKYFSTDHFTANKTFVHGLQDVEKFEVHALGRDMSNAPRTRKGFTLQYTLSGDLYHWDRTKYSGVARFNPTPEIQLQYGSPWMLNNIFRLKIKLFAYFPMQFHNPLDPTAIANGTGNKLNYNESTRFNEMRYELGVDITPYLSFSFKDSSTVNIGVRGKTVRLGQHVLVYEATSEVFLGNPSTAAGTFRKPIYSKLTTTLEHMWRPAVLPWWLQGFQVYTEYSFILDLTAAMNPNASTGSYDFASDELVRASIDFKLDWTFGSNVKISLPAFELKLLKFGKQDTIDAHGNKVSRVPFVGDFDIIVALLF